MNFTTCIPVLSRWTGWACNFKRFMFKPFLILVPDIVFSAVLVTVTDTLIRSTACAFFELFFITSVVINDRSAIFVKVKQYGCMGAAMSAATSPYQRGDPESHSCSVRNIFLTDMLFYLNGTKQNCPRFCIYWLISLPASLCWRRRKMRHPSLSECFSHPLLSMSVYPFAPSCMVQQTDVGSHLPRGES